MTQPLKEYLKNKEIRQNLPFHYNGSTDQRGYLLAEGILISEENVHEMYPLGSKITLWNWDNKGDNPDSTSLA